MSTKRGSGFRHTLPAVFPFAGVWVFVVLTMAPVVIIAMMMGGLVRPTDYSDVLFFLLTRMPVLAVAAVGLAVFTTHRAAGALVGLRLALEDVKRGDMGRQLRFRKGDKHFREIETAFNEMMDALRERTAPSGHPGERAMTSGGLGPWGPEVLRHVGGYSMTGLRAGEGHLASDQTASGHAAE